MDQATRCVRRFAPNNKRRMKAHDHGHITACKISDARPNEMIASWSGDHIYSFDIVKSPDARDKEAAQEAKYVSKRLKNQSEKKRKRAPNASSSSLADKAKPPQRLRRVADGMQEDGQTALRVQYEDGETSVSFADLPPRDALVVEARAQAERVAHALVKLRKTMFEFTSSAGDVSEMEYSTDLTAHTTTFTNVLGQCTALLPQMDEIIRGWTYPVNPSAEDILFQNTLRRNRQKSWRFIQAMGVLARTLGGTVQTTGSLDVSQVHFGAIKPASREEGYIDDRERFCYDFLRAITLWVTGGRGRLFAGFRRQADTDPKTERYPLDLEEGRQEELTRSLRQYLHDLADPTIPIVDLDANEFLTDDGRNVFTTQKKAVQAFMRAVDGTTLTTNGDAQSIAELEARQTENPEKQTQTIIMDKGAATRFWALKVGRSLLMQAAEGVNFDFVRRAFGGLGSLTDETVEAQLDEILGNAPQAESSSVSRTRNTETQPTVHVEEGDTASAFQEAYDAVAHADSDDNANSDSSDESASDSDADQEGVSRPPQRRRVAFGRSNERAAVNAHVPYSSHSRCYRGHLNARTVKDVNYYGLDDEYVVSGSDDGHFFIWERKTGEVVNILKGDGEVVNVVQGHPVEPMIAVSGIDSSVKIFGVGNRERWCARSGFGVANPGGAVHSSLRFGGRRRMMGLVGIDDGDEEVVDTNENEPAPELYDGSSDDDDEETPIAPNGLRSRKAMHRNYEIINQNDVARREEDRDAFLTVSADEGVQLLFARAWMLASLRMLE